MAVQCSVADVGRRLDSITQDLWFCNVTEPQVFDSLAQKLATLQAQVKVHKNLQEAAELLRQYSSGTSLPNQRATRVRQIIKSVFEGSERRRHRYAQLQSLQCNALKFCGLAYKIKDIMEMSDAEFDFLITHVEEYICRSDLEQYIYRDDVDKAVYSKIHPQNEAIYKSFLKGMHPSSHGSRANFNRAH